MLVRHGGQIDGGGAVTVGLIALYSVVMAMHALKDMRIELPSWDALDRRDQRSPFDATRI